MKVKKFEPEDQSAPENYQREKKTYFIRTTLITTTKKLAKTQEANQNVSSRNSSQSILKLSGVTVP